MGNFHLGVIMHSGQRLCSGHLSNEASGKVLTGSLGRLFPLFLLSLWVPNALPYPVYHPGPLGERLPRPGWRGEMLMFGKLPRSGRQDAVQA